MRRLLLPLAPCLASALVLVSCSSSPSPSPSSSTTSSTSTSTAVTTPPSTTSGSVASTGASVSWIVNNGTVVALERNGLSVALADFLFDNPRTYLVVSGRGGNELPLATRTQTFTSYATLENALNGGTLLPGVGAVLYDNEHWALTPSVEQLQPVHYAQLAATAVHAHGLKLIFTPAVNLTKVTGANGSRYTLYLDQGLAASGAATSDIFEIQAQQAETTGNFASFALDALSQARQANPRATVLVGLSTNPAGQPVSLSTLEQSFDEIVGVANGFWLNVPSSSAACPNCGTPLYSLAVSFLEAIAPRLGYSG